MSEERAESPPFVSPLLAPKFFWNNAQVIFFERYQNYNHRILIIDDIAHIFYSTFRLYRVLAPSFIAIGALSFLSITTHGDNVSKFKTLPPCVCILLCETYLSSLWASFELHAFKKLPKSVSLTYKFFFFAVLLNFQVREKNM